MTNAQLLNRFKWLEFNITVNNEVIEAYIDTESNSVSFTWHLFKKSESAKFEALIEDLDGEPPLEDIEELSQLISDSIVFSHRVYNLDKVTVNLKSIRAEMLAVSIIGGLLTLLTLGVGYLCVEDFLIYGFQSVKQVIGNSIFLLISTVLSIKLGREVFITLRDNIRRIQRFK